MFRVQVWDETVRRYVDVVFTFDRWGVVGFRPASLCDTIAEYNDLRTAWRDVCDLKVQIPDVTVTVLDGSTGMHVLGESVIVARHAEAADTGPGPEIWTDEWIVQRAARARTNDGDHAWAPWPGYSRAMTRDQVVKALEECEVRWPEYEFRAHRLRLEEKMAAEVINRARRSVQS